MSSNEQAQNAILDDSFASEDLGELEENNLITADDAKTIVSLSSLANQISSLPPEEDSATPQVTVRPQEDPQIETIDPACQEKSPPTVKELRQLFEQVVEPSPTETSTQDSGFLEQANSPKEGTISPTLQSCHSVKNIKEIFETVEFGKISTTVNVNDIMPKVVTITGERAHISKPVRGGNVVPSPTATVIMTTPPMPLPPSPRQLDAQHRVVHQISSPKPSNPEPFRSSSKHFPGNVARSQSVRRGSITMRSITPIQVETADLESRQHYHSMLDLAPYQRQQQQQQQQQQYNCCPIMPMSRSAYCFETNEKDFMEIPDGIYVRTGQVYERVEEGQEKKRLGHWVTTVFTPQGATAPLTQVTNVWMTQPDYQLKGPRPPIYHHQSLHDLNNYQHHHQQQEQEQEQDDVVREIPVMPMPAQDCNILNGTNNAAKRSPTMPPRHHSLPTTRQRPVAQVVERRTRHRVEISPHVKRKSYSRTPSPTHSWLSWASLSPPAPFRTRSLSSWADQANAKPTGHRAAPTVPCWRYVDNKPRMSRTPNRSVSFYERSLSRSRNHSPSPLFYSPEQVERRIKELRSEHLLCSRPHSSLEPRGMEEATRVYLEEEQRREWIEKARRISRSRLAFHNARGSSSPSPGCRNNTEELTEREIRHRIAHDEPPSELKATRPNLLEPIDVVAANNHNTSTIDSGIDYTPIATDFNKKCAYFEEVFKYQISPPPPSSTHYYQVVKQPSSNNCQQQQQYELSGPTASKEIDYKGYYSSGNEYHEPVRSLNRIELPEENNCCNNDADCQGQESVKGLIRRFDTNHDHHNPATSSSFSKVKKFSYTVPSNQF